MSFSKFLQCCFPKKKDQVVEDKEESYDIKYTSEEKKFEYNNVKSQAGIKDVTEFSSKQKIEEKENIKKSCKVNV
jgi:hypothetical protein